MESREYSQPGGEVGAGLRVTPIQPAVPATTASATNQPSAPAQQIQRKDPLGTALRRLQVEFALKKGSHEALIKASRSLLDEDERCKAVNEIAAASEEVQENALVFEEGCEMEREMRRLESLRAAWLAPRCEHIKPNGMRCGSPALGGQKFCFFHNLARSNAVEFPVVEDRRGLQVAILRVCERLANGSISATNAKILLEGLSLAAENARSIAEEDGELMRSDEISKD